MSESLEVANILLLETAVFRGLDGGGDGLGVFLAFLFFLVVGIAVDDGDGGDVGLIVSASKGVVASRV